MNLRRRFCSHLMFNLMKLPNLSRLAGGGTTFDKAITRETQEARRGVSLAGNHFSFCSALYFFPFSGSSCQQ